MSKKIILLTGSTSGIGKAASKELVKSASNLILPIRTLSKGEELKQELASINPECKIDLYLCDFSSMQSVKDFASQVIKNYELIDVLANNAGIFNGKIVKTADGIEETFQVNVLSQFILNNLLLPLIKKSKAGRIVNLSSLGHRGGKFNLDNLNAEQEKEGLGGGTNAYFNSNLYRNLLTKYQSQMLKDENSNITVNCMHPGAIRTALGTQNPGFVNNILLKMFALVTKKPEDGARTLVYLCLSDEVKDISGQYFVNCKIAKATPQSFDINSAQLLWDKCKAITNI